MASRFAQTLLKKLPACVDANPVKVAFSIAKATIEEKMWVVVSVFWVQADCCIRRSDDELAERLEETADRLLAVDS